MQPVSAADSVALAVERTREFLFRPFRWSSFLKLGLVAIVTEGLGNNFHSSSAHTDHGDGHGGLGATPSFPSFHPDAATIAIIAAAVALAIVLSLFIFYLITRLRFAFFHALVHNVKEIAPGWQLYRDQASRFFWLNVVVGICFFTVAALVAIPFAGLLWQVVQGAQAGHLSIGLLLALILPLIPVVIVFLVVGILGGLILRDWMMPHIALENATAGEAWRQVRARMKAEKRQFLVYAILRVILPTIAAIAVVIVLAIPGLLMAGVVAAIEFGVHSSFSGSTGASMFVGVALQIFFGLVALTYALLASICIGGPLSTGVREFALVFYGGRYEALGNILYPSQAIAGAAGGRA